MTMTTKAISVIIPTRNGIRRVPRLLDSIARQTLDQSLIEVIIIDDGSTDGTPALLKAMNFPFSCRVIKTNHAGPPHARNLGIQEATAEVVALFDDDIVCREDCFRNVLQHFNEQSISIVETNLLLEGTNRPLLRQTTEQGFITAAIFFRKRALLAVGGMDEQFWDAELKMFFRDDSDLGFRSIKSGYKSVFAEDVVAWHPEIFFDVRSSFGHVRRYFFDPLLFRKHPELYRTYIEKKRIGFIRFSRPMHYASLVYCFFLALSIVLLIAGESGTAIASSIAALLAYFIIRLKFMGKNVMKIWRITETVAFLFLPFVYFYWLARGSRKFGGWGVFI